MSRQQIIEIREDMARIATNARAKLNEITKDTPEARAEEIEREFDAMMAEHDKLDARAARLEKLEGIDAALRSADETRRPGAQGEARGQAEPGAISYREAFRQYMQAQGNLGAMDAEARAVLAAGYQKVEVEQRAQTAGTNSAGGFTVPEELQSILIRTMKDWGPMYDGDVVTEIVTTSGNSIPMPTVDDTAKVAGAHTEGATLTDDGGEDVTFGRKELGAFASNTEWIRVSKELADDSILAMEQLLGSLLGERCGRRANLWLTTGSGSGAPHGVATAAATGKTANGTAAITFDEIIDLEHSVNAAYRRSPKCAWMFNDTVLAAVRKLKDGDGNYLWQMGDVRNGVPDQFNGRRYYINDDMASLGASNKVMLFGDFSKYFVRKAGGILIGAIQDKDFWPGFGVAGYFRVDGELGDAAAIKALVCAAS